MTKEHEFGRYKTQAEWEKVIFENAIAFSTFEFGVGRHEFKTFAEAVEHARPRPRCLVYAIAASGRATVVERREWDFLQGIRERPPAVRKTVCAICNQKGGRLANINGRRVHSSCWRTERMS